MLLFALSLIACGEKETDTDDTGVTDTAADTEETDTDETDTEETDTEDTSTGEGLQGLGEGDLYINEIMKNPCGLDDDPNTEPDVECTDPQIADEAGEWFEIVNNTSAAINLNGLGIHETGDGEQVFVVTTDLTIEAGGYLVFGVSADTSLNGGVDVDYVYSHASFGFGNSGDSIALSNDAGVIDSVEYDNGETFHDFKGYSLNLDPNSADATSNDDGANWCQATTMLSSGDYGTPGAANDACE